MVSALKWICLVYCFGWTSDFTGIEQWGRTVIFAQASSSRLGESSKGSPRGFRSSTRSGGKSSSWAKNYLALGEMTSPKREFAKLPRPLFAVSPKREPAAWARALLLPEWGLLVWVRPAADHTVFSPDCYWLYDWLVCSI